MARTCRSGMFAQRALLGDNRTTYCSMRVLRIGDFDLVPDPGRRVRMAAMLIKRVVRLDFNWATTRHELILIFECGTSCGNAYPSTEDSCSEPHINGLPRSS